MDWSSAKERFTGVDKRRPGELGVDTYACGSVLGDQTHDQPTHRASRIAPHPVGYFLATSAFSAGEVGAFGTTASGFLSCEIAASLISIGTTFGVSVMGYSLSCGFSATIAAESVRICRKATNAIVVRPRSGTEDSDAFSGFPKDAG